jgi:F-type H+-transporting ATPase subunit alpha
VAEITIKPEEITEALRKYAEEFETSVEREEVGRVMEAGDGIATVEGMPNTMALELLEFPGDVYGIAFNLDAREIGCVILGDDAEIEEGSEVKHTGRVLSVPVGDAFLGRVIDPLGRPLDGKGDIESSETRPLEIQAPSVVQRKGVHEPLQTGLKAIDAMTPIGRGQRQLIIGDRQTGKTAIAVDAIINQRVNWGTEDQVKCVYVAIGQKASTVAEVVNALEENGALEYTVVINAPAAYPSSFKYVAPYAGSALGQHWMYKGEHALVVFDDLSKQAEAYREVSLLLRRPAGREAYPGDVFYLHSRLLERCAKLNDELGGGSLTGLPIVETKGGDVSAYIPTNVISITDGQIYLESDLFYSGVRPAINVGISVSRVGGNAQIKAMKDVAGRLRLDLSQYRDLEAFAEFGSDLDKASQEQLERGERTVELLKQRQYQPMTVDRQVVAIWAVTQGHMDDVPVEDISRFEEEFLSFVDQKYSDIFEHVKKEKTLPDHVRDQLGEAVKEFRRQFQPSESEGRAALEDASLPLTEEEQERLKKFRPPSGRDGRDGSRLDGSQASDDPPADQVGPVDEEDHVGDGDDRRVPDPQGPESDGSGAPLRRPDHPGDPGHRVAGGQGRAPDAGGAREPVLGRRGRDDVRQGPRRRLQRERPAPRRGAPRQAETRRQGRVGLRGGAQGDLLLPLPRPRDQKVVAGVLGKTRLRSRQRGRRRAHRALPGKGRRRDP